MEQCAEARPAAGALGRAEAAPHGAAFSLTVQGVEDQCEPDSAGVTTGSLRVPWSPRTAAMQAA